MPSSRSSTIPLSSLGGLISANGVFDFPVCKPEIQQKATLTAVERAEKAALKSEKAALKAERAALTAIERAEKAAIKAEKAAIKAEKATLKEQMKTLHATTFISTNLSPEKTVFVSAHTRRAPVRK